MDLLFSAPALLLLMPLLVGVTTTDTDWIEVFRAGDYPQGTFSEADVQELAERYDTGRHEAPVTTDHRQTGPAFGWIKTAKAQAGRLFVKLKQVPKAFAEAVNDRRFHSRSIELFEVDGAPYLKSLTFLGARAPQIKGLDPVGQIEFSQEMLSKPATVIRFDEDGAAGDDAEQDPLPTDDDRDASEKDKETDASETGADDDDEDELDEDKDEALPDDEEEDEKKQDEDEEEFSEAGVFARFQQQFAQLQSENQRLREQASEAEREQASKEFEQFAAEKVPPRIRDRAEAVFFALRDAEENGHITFAHDDHDSALACFKEVLEDLSFGHLFGEFADEGPSDDGSGDGDDMQSAVRETMVEQGTA